MVRPRLCTSMTADKREVDEALTALRRTIRLGRMAERALRQLEETGRCVKAPVLFRVNDRGRVSQLKVRLESFHPFQEVTRDEVPGYGSHVLDFLVPDPPYKSISVLLVGGQVWMDSKQRPVFRPIPSSDQAILGTISIKRNGPVINVFGRDFRVKNKSVIGSLEANLAVRASELIIDPSYSPPHVRLDELRSRLVHWLMEDGFPSRWISEMVNISLTNFVMTS
jgi:hypothetical protein